MELPRQDPEQLLRAIRTEEPPEGHGKLKIFFGYAAGVGKTYAMLEAAHQAKQRGIDVVAGYYCKGYENSPLLHFILAVIPAFVLYRLFKKAPLYQRFRAEKSV